MGGLVYYSSSSGNTARFIARSGLHALRIPSVLSDPLPMPDGPFVLICPTYSDGEGKGAVARPVIRFLNCPERRALLRGVIATGNRNFGTTYALAGRVISEKCHVAWLTSFELAGTDADIARIRAGLDQFWRNQCPTAA